jgi:hypothetical protein
VIKPSRVIVLVFAIAVVAPSPVAAQQVGSGGVAVGVARSADSPWSVAGRLDLLATLGPVGVGPELGYARLGRGSRVWNVGVAVRVVLDQGVVSPYLTTSAGRYDWKEQGEVVLLGGSLGAGAIYRPPGSRLGIGLEGRWHPTLQNIDSRKTLFTFSGTTVLYW